MITERSVQRRSPGVAEPAPRVEERRDRMAVFRGYVALTKPAIVELLLVTTVPTMMLAAGGWPDLVTFFAVLVGGALAGGAASALNCYIDRDIDVLMKRTKRRPLPSHQITPRAVLIFGRPR
jgi:protoheme IX farnesyltransferase